MIPFGWAGQLPHSLRLSPAARADAVAVLQQSRPGGNISVVLGYDDGTSQGEFFFGCRVLVELEDLEQLPAVDAVVEMPGFTRPPSSIAVRGPRALYYYLVTGGVF